MTPSTAQLIVQATADPEVRAYHLRYLLSEVTERGIRGDCEESSEICKLFLNIPGVVTIILGPYLVLLGKGPLYLWSEIDPSVENILTTFVNSQSQLQKEDQALPDEVGPVN